MTRETSVLPAGMTAGTRVSAMDVVLLSGMTVKVVVAAVTGASMIAAAALRSAKTSPPLPGSV